MLDSRDAVRRAKEYVRSMFADEHVHNVALEEVDFDDLADAWCITVGFNRELPQPALARLSAAVDVPILDPRRVYKVVRLSNVDGKIFSLKNREVNVVS